MNINISAMSVQKFAKEKWSKRHFNHHILVYNLKSKFFLYNSLFLEIIRKIKADHRIFKRILLSKI